MNQDDYELRKKKETDEKVKELMKSKEYQDFLKGKYEKQEHYDD